MGGADGMSAKFMKNAFVGWTFTAGMYYPPDFDPKQLMPLKMLKPSKSKADQLLNIRMMFPFTMICDACGEYNYTGTKFTSKVETIKSESYLGLKVYRFYGRCKHCWSEFTFKTDPKNSDYTMESGGKRTYEAWKDADMMESQIKAEKEEDRDKDQMKALEQKSIDVQAEMQRIEDLDTIRTLNKRNGLRDLSIEGALEYLFRKMEMEAAQEEELPDGDIKELALFKEAQEEQERNRLDKEVADDRSQERSSASTSTSAIDAAISQRASQATGRPPGVGARFQVKRKAPDADCEEENDAKRHAVASVSTATGSVPSEVGDGSTDAVSPADGAAEAGFAEGASATRECDALPKGIGLGAYDSDQSDSVEPDALAG